MGVAWFLTPDKTRIPSTSKNILGFGRTGIVLRHGENALKIARIEDTVNMPDDERYMYEALNEMNLDALHNEIEIYKRLGSHHPGLLPIFQLSSESIEMACVTQGSLTKYIRTHAEPADALKAELMDSVTSTFSYVHKCRVTVGDVALRNFLIDDELAIKLIDFGLSTLHASEACATDTVNDIIRLGFIIYSIAAWKVYDYDEYEDGSKGSSSLEGKSLSDSAEQMIRWPRVESLPSVDGCFGGDIAYKCWTGGYEDVEQVCKDVKRATGGLLQL